MAIGTKSFQLRNSEVQAIVLFSILLFLNLKKFFTAKKFIFYKNSSMPHFHKRLPLNIIAISFSLLSGCSQKTKHNYKKTDNGVVFDIGNAKLSINIFDTAIMQVRYTLADSFSTKKSLIIEDKKWPQIPFEVTDAANDSDVIIST